MQIENRPAEDVIRLYDEQETLFYCDPLIRTSREATNAPMGTKWATKITAASRSCSTT